MRGHLKEPARKSLLLQYRKVFLFGANRPSFLFCLASGIQFPPTTTQKPAGIPRFRSEGQSFKGSEEICRRSCSKDLAFPHNLLR
jgi:hypothetical protein